MLPFELNKRWLKAYTQVVIALRTRGTERVRIPRESLPLLGVVLASLLGSKPVPDTRVNLAHLRLLDQLYFAACATRTLVIRGRKERPRCVVRTAPCRCPDLDGKGTCSAMIRMQIAEADTHDESVGLRVKSALLQRLLAAGEHKLAQLVGILPSDR